MKHLRETFTDEEWIQLKKVKESWGTKINWHDFLLTMLLNFNPTIVVDRYCQKCGSIVTIGVEPLSTK